MIRPVHANVDRIFTKAEMRQKNSPSPQDKFYRYRPEPEIQNLADQLRRLVTTYKIDKYHIKNILIPKFGKSVGHQTFEIFLDPVYGAGMRPRKPTLEKYRYLLRRLREIHKDFKEERVCIHIDL